MDTAAWIAVIRLVLKLAGVENISVERIKEIAEQLVGAWKLFWPDDSIPADDDMAVLGFEAYMESLNRQAALKAAKEGSA